MSLRIRFVPQIIVGVVSCIFAFGGSAATAATIDATFQGVNPSRNITFWLQGSSSRSM